MQFFPHHRQFCAICVTFLRHSTAWATQGAGLLRHNPLPQLFIALLSFFFILFPSVSQAIVVNTVANDGVTVAQITAALQGAGVTISNMTIVNNGNNCLNRNQAVGIFNSGTTPTGPGPVLGDASGVVLGTGPLKTPGDFLVSPNSDSRWDNTLCTANVTDPDMFRLEPQTANGEYIAIEFDIVPSQSIMVIPFQFGSDEFPEYVCTNYNDVTGIFVSGPGISGPYLLGAQNFAKTIGGDLTSINWVNTGQVGVYGNGAMCGSLTNTAYYTDNSNGDLYGGNATVATTNANLELDGWTNYIYQPITVVPGATYHVKAAIADAGDRNWDSAVFFHLIFSSGTLPGFDFGDAPESYRTLTASGGPRHGISNQIFLGANLPDNEVTGQPTVTAAGDDLTGVDDEDGIASFPSLNTSATAYSVDVTVTNTTGSVARLVGWIDFNRNGTFETAEGVSVNVATGTVNGTSTLSWSGLSGLVGGTTYARFRLTTDPFVTTATPGGSATNGEVEDYTLTIMQPVLSTSTKTVVDENGGDVEFNDILRYIITLNETGGVAASNVQVTDDIPGNITAFTVTGTAGGTNNSTYAGTGANGTGYLNITGITVPANGSVTITYTVQVSGADGSPIANNATVINPGGPGALLTAPTLIIAGASLPGAGLKQLYVQPPTVSGGLTGALSRTPSTVDPIVANRYRLNGVSTATLSLSPALQTALNLNPNYQIVLQMLLNNNQNRTVSFTLQLQYRLGAATTVIDTQTVNQFMTRNVLATYAFPFNLAATALPAGAILELLVTNNAGNRDVWLYPYNTTLTDSSRVELNSATVINVDSFALFDTLGAPLAQPVAPGTEVHIRATVSDPFGSYDISTASLTLTDALGVVQVNAQPMNFFSDSGAATKTFEYIYTLPANAAPGNWIIRTDANEGTEGTISDYGMGTMAVAAPVPPLSIIKWSTTPSAKPGQNFTYWIQVDHSGTAPASNIYIDDFLSPYLYLATDTYGAGVPINFVEGTPASGLTKGTTLFSQTKNTTFGYTPISGGGGAPAGTDGNVTNWRQPLTGTMNPGGRFYLQFQVQVR